MPDTRDQSRTTPPRPQPPRWAALLWLAGFLALAAWWLQAAQAPAPQELAYSTFKSRVRAGDVAEATLRGQRVIGRLSGGHGDGGAERFATTLPPIDDPELMPLLEDHDVTVRAESRQAAWWQRALIGLLPWVLIIALFWYAGYRMQQRMASAQSGGGLFGFARSKAKRFRREDSRVDFGDVAGAVNAKRDLREITDYLVDPERYRALGAKIPRGILLMGPPGTGKTLLARAVAGEAGVPFFSISGSEFIEMFVGVGASRVRDMFDGAKREAPSIIFIDEIDSVGRARGTGVGGGHDEREQTLNQILGEMDGFEPHQAVVVLAATNRPDVLDPALLRPGRFDRKVTLDLPERGARRAILDIHARDIPLAEDVDLDRLAALCAGFAGADLENLVNEAALLAGSERRDRVDMATLLEARDKVVLGGRRELAMDDDEKRLVASHEAGHVVAASALPHADPPDKVTIIPRGRALGATEQVPREERRNLRASYLRDRIGVMLGGRVAEELLFGESSSGAESDLEQATQLARRMVARWGMSAALGPLAFRRGEEHVFLGREMAQQRDFAEHTARIIDEEMGCLVRGVEDDVRRLLEERRCTLEALAEALVERETLDHRDIDAIISASSGTVRGGRCDEAAAQAG